MLTLTPWSPHSSTILPMKSSGKPSKSRARIQPTCNGCGKNCGVFFYHHLLRECGTHPNGEAKVSSSQAFLQMPLLVMEVYKYVHNSLQTQQGFLHMNPCPPFPQATSASWGHPVPGLTSSCHPKLDNCDKVDMKLLKHLLSIHWHAVPPLS